MLSFYRCTRSSTDFGSLIHQGGNTKYEGVSKMFETIMVEGVKNCLKRRPKVRMAFGLVSNNFIYLLWNTASFVGCKGSDLISEAYCRDSFARLAPKQGSSASTYNLSTGEVLKCSKTKSKVLVVFTIKHLQVRLKIWSIHNLRPIKTEHDLSVSAPFGIFNNV